VFKKKLFSLFLGFGIFVFLGIHSISPARAEFQLISENTTWTAAGSPYVLLKETIVTENVTLTLEPGTIVKGYRNGALTVRGELVAIGTEDNPIIFTSVKDDSVGGDTNKDGNLTIPRHGDWPWVRFASGSTGTIQHAIIRYGGKGWSVLPSYHSQLAIEGSSPTISNVRIENGYNWAGYGIKVLGSNSVIEDCVITNDLDEPDLSNAISYGIWIDGGSPHILRNEIYNNGASGIILVEQYYEIGNPEITDNRIYNNGDRYYKIFGKKLGLNNETDNLIDVRNNWWGDDSGPKVVGNEWGLGQEIIGNPVLYDPWIGKKVKTPVLLVPGIISTELKKDDDLLWLDLSQIFTDRDDSFLDVLAMNSDGIPTDLSVVAGNIIKKLDLPAPVNDYDIWEGLISELEANGYKEGVDLFFLPYDWRLDLKYSSKEFTKKLNEIRTKTGASKIDVVAHSMGGLVVKRHILDNADHGINKLVFIGTPHLGAPKALKALMFGEAFTLPGLSNKKMKELSQNMFSNYELLPSAEYFAKNGGYFVDATDRSNLQLLDYSETKNLLNEKGLNAKAISATENFHNSTLDNIDLLSVGIDTYNISGCDSPSIKRIVKVNSSHNEDKYLLQMGPGDGTVPFSSSTAIISNKEFYVKKADHGQMPSNSTVRKLVTGILGNSPDYSDSLPGLITDTNKCKVSGKLISVHSPVDLHIYDSQGNHVGPDDNGGYEENIQGVVYEVLGGNKFVFLPTLEGEEYGLKLNATDTGFFDLRVGNILDDENLETVYYNSVAISNFSKAEMVVNDNSLDTELQLDYNGTGNYETVNASSVLGSNESMDLTPPESFIALAGINGNNGWFRSKVGVVLFATDDNSGVLKIEYSLDDGATWKLYTTPFDVETDGFNTLLYRATDKAGNTEIYKTEVISIDTTPPEATLGFNLSSLKLEVIGKDDLSTVSVSQVDNYYILEDKAGNTTEILLAQQSKTKSLYASVTSLLYNGVESLLDRKNKVIFSWSFDKFGALKKLVQKSVVTKEFNITASYNSLNGTTKLTGKDQSGKIKEFYSNLIDLFLFTNKGNLIYATE